MELLIYGDCDMLLDNFVEAKKLTFPAFAYEWNELKFHQLWAAQSSYIQVCQTTATALHYAKRTACGLQPNGTQLDESKGLEVINALRIGSIFLMYVLYFKQPTREFVKIEVTLETWKELNNFLASLEGIDVKAYHECKYIFGQLCNLNAFNFTVVDHCRGIEPLIDYDNPPIKINGGGYKESYKKACLAEDLPMLKNIQEQIRELEIITKHYNNLQQKLQQTEQMQTLEKTKELTQIFDKVIKQSQEKVEHKKGSTAAEAAEVDEEEEPTTSTRATKSNKKPMTIGDKREILRRKAFGEVMPKEETDNETDMDIDDEEGVTKAKSNTTPTTTAMETTRRSTLANVLKMQLPADLSREIDEDEE